MKVTTYAYDGNETVTELPDNIAEILYEVISGDEVVEFTCVDGSVVKVDSGKREGRRRLYDFHDGHCFLGRPEEIEAWLDFKPKKDKGSPAESYQRLDMVYEMRNSDETDEDEGDEKEDTATLAAVPKPKPSSEGEAVYAPMLETLIELLVCLPTSSNEWGFEDGHLWISMYNGPGAVVDDVTCRYDLYDMAKSAREELEDLKRHLMPQDMPWPRFKGGQLAKLGDAFNDGDETHRITSISVYRRMGCSPRRCFGLDHYLYGDFALVDTDENLDSREEEYEDLSEFELLTETDLDRIDYERKELEAEAERARRRSKQYDDMFQEAMKSIGALDERQKRTEEKR